MTATKTARPPATADARSPRAMMARLQVLDRFLPVWIGAAMAAGLLLGRPVPGLNSALNRVAIHGTSLPIAGGLLLMMYPVLAKVRYSEIGRITGDRRMMTASLVLNWVIGPAVMFALAWLLLPDQPAYRTGVILVGLACARALASAGGRELWDWLTPPGVSPRLPVPHFNVINGQVECYLAPADRSSCGLVRFWNPRVWPRPLAICGRVRGADAAEPGVASCFASSPIKMARTSPMASSWLAGSGSGRCAWI
jgi:hypothetical protein